MIKLNIMNFINSKNSIMSKSFKIDQVKVLVFIKWILLL